MFKMEKIYVEDVTLNEGEDLESRECICTLSNGTEIHIVACYESWQQYGGTQNELWLTVNIAEAINDWLGGYTKDELAKHCDSVPVMSCILRSKIKKEMKKAMLLALTTLMMVGCGKEQRVIHKYEVLLSTKDTMYVDAWYYSSSSSTFTSKRTIVFYDTNWMDFLRINDPIYIREIK